MLNLASTKEELAPVVSKPPEGWRDGGTDGCVSAVRTGRALEWHAEKGRAVVARLLAFLRADFHSGSEPRHRAGDKQRQTWPSLLERTQTEVAK